MPKKLLYYSICFFLLLVFFQINYVGYTYYLHHKKFRDLTNLNFSCVLKERNSKKTIILDPIRGFKLLDQPSRILRITKGDIEYYGKEVGNNQYFQDRDDWLPNKSNQSNSRWAVFGNSFTAAPYLEINWPDLVEDQVDKLVLMNFSIDGGGLANWYSILTNIIESENYDIDGIIIANFRGNLYRGFTIADQSDNDKYMFNRIGFNEKEWPRTRSEAVNYLNPSSYAFYVDPNIFENILYKQEHWKKNLINIMMSHGIEYNKGFKIRLAGIDDVYSLAIGLLRKYLPDKYKTFLREMQYKLMYGGSFSEEQLLMIEKIKEYKTKRKIPIIVIDLPTKSQLLEKNFDSHVGTLEFMKLVETNSYYNFAKIAYDYSSTDEVFENYFPYDGHWNQKGSDKFARFFVDHVIDEMSIENL